MVLQRKISFTILLLVFGSFSAQAYYPIWYDTAATAVVINKPSCFVGIIRSAYYIEGGSKDKTLYMYIHLDYPINIFPISTTGDLWFSSPVGHQYDFGLVFNTDKVLYHTEKLTNKTVQVFGSIASPPTGFDAPTVLAMKILGIKVLNSYGAYKSVCHVKSSHQFSSSR